MCKYIRFDRHTRRHVYVDDDDDDDDDVVVVVV
jgi:hypothetical protein